MLGEDQRYKEHILDPNRLQLYYSERGELVVNVDGEEYADPKIRRAFPLESSTRFIGFFLSDGAELGLLEDVDELAEDSRALLLKELGKIYFCPLILGVDHIDEEFGVVNADVETSSGPRHIEIRQIRKNIRLLSGHRALIEDTDGNRYELRDWHHLPKLTREILGL